MVDNDIRNRLTLLGIIGSLRAGSVNAAAARAAMSLTPKDVTILLHDVGDLPLYNGDIEAAGLPPAVERLHDAVGAADGLLLFSPEYNGSFPAVTKNVIDWLSRPPRAWNGTPVTMVTVSPGPRAGMGVREHFSATFERQPTRLFDTLGIGTYGDKLDADGELVDAATLEQLSNFLSDFVDFCRAAP